MPATIEKRATRRVYLKRKAIASIPAITPIGSKEPVSVTLPRAVRRIAKELRPDKIIWFGSYAYGTPTPDSDVDLLVVMERPSSYKEQYLSVARLIMQRPFAVDIILKTPDELRSELNRRNFFLREVVTKGKTLYERPQ